LHQQTPQQPSIAESFQPVSQNPESEGYSSLTSDVPPGVVVHSGPVSKGRKKEQSQSTLPIEDPNRQPGMTPLETETVASYDYTLPPDSIPNPPVFDVQADAPGYVPPAPDEQQKMYQMFEPPHARSTEELLAEALAKNSESEVLEPNYLESSTQSAHTQAGPDEQSFDEYQDQYDTGHAAPPVEQYNYTAPHDPAVWEEPGADLEHRPRCTGCGTYLEVGSQFCGECGTRLEARIPGCHLCGSPLEPSAKFCGECGSKCIGSMPKPSTPAPDRILDPHRIPDRQSEEYEQYVSQSTQKPTQRSWVVKLLKMLET
jgi:hypothetical protein